MVMTESFLNKNIWRGGGKCTLHVELCLHRREASHGLGHLGGFCSFSAPQGTWLDIHAETLKRRAREYKKNLEMSTLCD